MKRLNSENRSGAARTGLLLLAAAAALVALFALTGWAHLLLPSAKGGKGGLKELREAIGKVEGPATVVFGATSGIGLLAGGAMAGMGMPQGVRLMTMSGLAGGGVLLGRGLIK
ncbi:MAG TPA: hypothetical protein VGG40_05370 [Solirubrobacterales bacterium]|jgi:hypothetical protein